MLLFLGSALFSQAQYKFASKTELKTAVDAWFKDSVTTASTYGNISTWDVSDVTDMSYLFIHATNFNSDISLWDVSNVTDMTYMFFDASTFNSDISKWDVSKVTSMLSMFSKTKIFNSDISLWEVSKVTDMWGIFESSTNFNSDISLWDVSKVTDMWNVLWKADSFSTENYNKLLKAWSNLNLQPNLEFIASTKYCDSISRQKIINDFGWTITDGGLASDSVCNSVLTSNDALIQTNNRVQISPNPAQQYITIQVNESNTSQNITICDVIGNKVYEQKNEPLNNSSIDVSELVSGTYIIHVDSDNVSYNSRFVKE